MLNYLPTPYSVSDSQYDGMKQAQNGFSTAIRNMTPFYLRFIHSRCNNIEFPSLEVHKIFQCSCPPKYSKGLDSTCTCYLIFIYLCLCDSYTRYIQHINTIKES